jgi:beta-phosphoglucomutase-like phosphatase (HAD superfamily)
VEVLRWTGVYKRDMLIEVEDYLIAAENMAVESAGPTPFAIPVIQHFVEVGQPVAVVSNNSESAMSKYLTKYGVDAAVSFVSARAYADPALMKPNPIPLTLAADRLGVKIADAVLIGDATTDIEASRLAGAKSIGYANKPGKREALAGAGLML